MNQQREDRQQELKRFKTKINLSEVTAVYGFDIKPKKSSPNSQAMVNPDGEKIILAMRGEQWVHFVPYTNCSRKINNPIQFRQELNLGPLYPMESDEPTTPQSCKPSGSKQTSDLHNCLPPSETYSNSELGL